MICTHKQPELTPFWKAAVPAQEWRLHRCHPPCVDSVEQTAKLGKRYRLQGRVKLDMMSLPLLKTVFSICQSSISSPKAPPGFCEHPSVSGDYLEPHLHNLVLTKTPQAPRVQWEELPRSKASVDFMEEHYNSWCTQLSKIMPK